MLWKETSASIIKPKNAGAIPVENTKKADFNERTWPKW